MTPDRSAGTLPAGPTDSLGGLTRGSAIVGAGLLATLNAQADQIIGSLTYQTPTEVLLGLAGISAIIWVAMAAAWKIASESRRAIAGWLDYALIGAVVFLSFIPLSYAAQAGLLLCGVYLLATAGDDDAERRSALVLLSLTGPLIWGRLLLHVFEAPILSLDAHIVGTIIGSDVHGNVVRFAGSSERFLIGGPCSSVHNMSLAIVLWATAAMLFRIRIDRHYAMIGVAMAALMFLLNVTRLAAIGLFADHFSMLHYGAGAALFGWAGLVGAALLAASGVTHAAARQR